MNIIRVDIDQTRAQVSWQSYRDPRTGVWIAVCEALGLTAEGDTWQELTKTIGSIQEHLFQDLLREGELQEFLRRRGWKLIDEPKAPPAEPWDYRFDVPIPVVISEALQKQARERHAR